MRVLFLTHRLPYAPNRGDRIRAYHMLRELARRAEVDLVSLVHDAAEQGHVDDLRAYAHVRGARISTVSNYIRGAALMATRRPLTHALLDSREMPAILQDVVAERRPDVVLAYCSGMARFALEPPLRGIPLVLDMMDVDSEKWAALGRTSAQPRRWIYRREASCLGAFEADAVRHAVVTLVVNDKEKAVLAAAAPGADIRVLPNGIDVATFRPTAPPSGEPRVVFCGVMNYGPNVEAARWMAERVWPIVRTARPDARLVLVGADPVREVSNLPGNDASIEVTGTVPDVRPFLWSAAVGAAPLLTARGLQNKVLEAIAAGLPSVVTSIVAEGLPPQAMSACTVAARGDADAFAKGVIAYLALPPVERRAIATRADLNALSWDVALAPLMPIIEWAARQHPRG